MRAPVKLAVLHDMTDNDLALEHRLFKSFMESAAHCIAVMENSWNKGLEHVWHQQAHALKGLCLNLGAEHLSRLCKKAQDYSAASPEEKQNLLGAIRKELENVKWYLEKDLR